jgi:outer membrane protein assembly factor BamB
MPASSLSALLLLSLLAQPEQRGDLAVIPGEVAGSARRLAAADKLADRGQWSDAIDEYQRILREAGDDLVPLTPYHAVRARWLCHQRLASAPAEQLKHYQARVDPQARKWFEQGSAQRDEALLQRVMEEAFCSSYGDRALDLLGDLAFERGRFEDARRFWRMILGPRKPVVEKGKLVVLHYPRSSLDPARIQAKLLLAEIFQGEGTASREALAGELEAYRSSYPKAAGRLAGKEGTYASILSEILDKMPGQRYAAETAAWPTFGGDPSRNLAVSGATPHLRRLCLEPPRWRFDLETHSRRPLDAPVKMREKPWTRSAWNRLMAFEPMIVGDSVLVADARSVVAYSMTTGLPSVWYDARREQEGFENLLNVKLPAPADLRYTLTFAEGRVYARMGVQELTADGEPDSHRSFLVCLAKELDEKGRRLRWQISPDEVQRGGVFEGAPIVQEGRIYIAATRVEGGNTITGIHCYSARDEGPPRLLWKRDVCSTHELRGKEHRLRHHLLTLAGPLLVYCSHSGAIVGLDSDSGRPAWAVRYPSNGGTTQPADGAETIGSRRDLTPCVYAAGRIFAAPADYDHVLCLDPATGQMRWDRGGLDIVHLLGVTRGKLICTLHNAIRALDIATGADRWQMPDVGTFLVPQGRGFLAEDLIFWPTAEGLKVLQAEDGQQSLDFPPGVVDSRMPHERMGNMVYANGCLAIAGPEELFLYLAPGKLQPERQSEARLKPDSAAVQLRLAQAEADAGLSQQALGSFQRAQKLASDASLCDTVRAERHRYLLEQADRAAAGRNWSEAAEVLKTAAAPDFLPAEQVQARARQAQMWTLASQQSQASAAWQSILDDPKLRDCQIEDAQRNPQRAATLAKAAIGRLIRRQDSPVCNLAEMRARQTMEAVGVSRAAMENIVPLLRSWENDLAPQENLLIPEDGSKAGLSDHWVFFGSPATGGGRLRCCDAVTGNEKWQAFLPFQPRWIDAHLNLLLVAGDGGVACLCLIDGKPVWEGPRLGRLTSCRQCGSRVFFLENHKRLLALDAAKGLVLWSRWAPAAHLGLPEPSGTFCPHFLAAADRLLVQTAGGHCWFLDAATGRLLQDWTNSSQPWRCAPVLIERQAACLASGPKRVVLLDLNNGKERWHFDLTEPSSLAGEMPEYFAQGNWLYVLSHRNYGTTVQALDVRSGSPRWPQDRFLARSLLTAEQVCVDEQAICHVAENVMHAHSLADGKPLWTIPLADLDADWRVTLLGPAAVVWPAKARRSWPVQAPPLLALGKAGPELKVAAVGESLLSSLPVGVCNLRTGRLIQRLNLSPAAAQELPEPDGKPRALQTSLTLLHSSRGFVLATQGRACRLVPMSEGSKR